MKIKIDYHKWIPSQTSWKEQLIDVIELLHNKGIIVISILMFLKTDNLFWLILFIYGIMFDLKIQEEK